MRRCLEACGGTPVLGATGVATLILLVVGFPALPIGGEMLDVRGAYTHSEALAALESYGEAGRRVYFWASVTLDTLLPVLYASFLAGLLYRFRPVERLWGLAFLPVAAGLVDLGENIQILLMLARYPDISAGQVAVASLFTSAKGAAVLVCLGLALAFALVAGVRRLRAGSRGS